MYAMMAPVEAGNVQACNVHFETPNLAPPMIRELREDELEAVFGNGCGIDATYGAALGFVIGGVPGALIGAAIAGGFCVAGNAV